MKLLVWSDTSFEQTYASYHLIEGILNALLDAGHEVYLLQKKLNTGEMPESLHGRDHLHIINIPWQDPEKTSFVKRYLDSFKYYRESGKKLPDVDAVFLQSNNTAIVPVNICRKKHIPVVYNVQDIFPIDALVVGKLSKNHPAFIGARFLQASAYKKADRVITISKDLAKTITRESHRKVDIIYNWSYRDEPYVISNDQNHFLNTYNIKRSDGFRVVYAGNIGQMVDAETLVQTAIRLKLYPDIKFYIIGTGSNIAYLKKRTEEEKINILFYPSQPMEYAPDNYCMADVNINPVPKGVMFTCMPSKTNTCLLSQKPTVVSMDSNSDMAKKLSKVDQWTVVAPGDADGMAEGILRIYQSVDWKNGESVLSSNAASFMQKLGPVENAKKYVKILEEVAGK